MIGFLNFALTIIVLAYVAIFTAMVNFIWGAAHGNIGQGFATVGVSAIGFALNRIWDKVCDYRARAIAEIDTCYDDDTYDDTDHDGTPPPPAAATSSTKAKRWTYPEDETVPENERPFVPTAPTASVGRIYTRETPDHADDKAHILSGVNDWTPKAETLAREADTTEAEATPKESRFSAWLRRQAEQASDTAPTDDAVGYSPAAPAPEKESGIKRPRRNSPAAPASLVALNG